MLKFLLILGVISFVQGCTPLIEHDQNKYCRSMYAFTATVLSSEERNVEAVFKIRVNENIKMVLGYPREIVTVYGRGTLHSCGPTKLDKNKEYFLYVSVNDATTNKPIINQFHEASFANITRVNSYVCSCTVVVNLPWQPIPESLRPARDICIITPDEFDWSFERGYCARRGDRSGSGPCKWIAPKTAACS
eukprot:XP_011435039.1 PREDICTED: uncharacterized protein LOC105333665 [Crassostrea gigas]